ncbi:MAG: hypothetical protein NTW60_03070, partial [Candidatus Wolfebacteria bacterium]|nr:hypothetical protein [Candidatus Wolfebacteria bacterium]
ENPIPFLLWGLEGYRDEIKNIKDKVLKKVKQLMFSDYIQYLLRNKKNEKTKINHRVVDILQLLVLKGRVPLKKFLSTPEAMALYSNVAKSTRVRDFQKMESIGLIKGEEIDNKYFIEPNYRLLDYVTYNV